MFKYAGTVTAFFLSVFAFSQEYLLPNEIGEDFVFFKDNESKVHILKNNIDYVFENNEWRKNILDHNQSYRDSSVIFYTKRFDNISFKAINTDTQTFLVLNGGGPVLQVEKDKIFRIDNSVEQKNQIGASVFQHNNQLHMHGGYGFWTYKDYTTHFDSSTKQWDLCLFEPSFKINPRWKAIFHKTKNNLFVLGGRATLIENQRIDAVINDAFKIDFTTKKVELLTSELNPEIPLKSSSFEGFNINSQKGYLYRSNIVAFDFENNTVTEYETKNIFAKKLSNSPVISLKDSLAFIKKTPLGKALEFVSIEKAIKNPLKTVLLFKEAEPEDSFKSIFEIIFATLIVFFLFKLFGYKDYIKKLTLHDGQWLYYSGKKTLIAPEQSKIISLLETNGEFSSLELNNILSKNKKFAKSHLTFLRQQFVERLNKVYQNLTETKTPLLSSKKNPSDKRQIIYFASKKIFKKESFFEYMFKL